MKFNDNFVAGIAYIAFMVGLACADVGEPYSEGVYSWWLPLAMLVMCVVPFVLGYYSNEKK